MKSHPFEPKLITVFKEGYKLKTFYKDCVAGFIVGIVALPLSIALAIASGVKPEQGLITAVVAGFLISAFSGSRVQIGGPTGAFIVIVYGIIQKYGYDGLAVATIMAGVLLIIMGFARLGDVIKFIPYPVTVGFTSGIALIIFTSQIKYLLGITATVPEHFLNKWIFYFNHSADINLLSVLLGVTTIMIIYLWPKINDRIPGPLVAILATTAVVHALKLPVATIETSFGVVPNTIPAPHIPHFHVEMLTQLASPALTIALLAGIESLLSAVVADGMTGFRHRSNMELIAQGIANIASPLFNGIPATGAIARTATNIKNGGTTPIAGIIHALTVLLLFLVFAPWASLIPMATLAGILIVVAYHMSEWQLFIKIFRSPKSDILVLLATFLLTVLVDLTVAIEVGMILAAFLFMREMVAVTKVDYINKINESEDRSNPETIAGLTIPSGVEVFEINGPFFFGAVDKFKDTLREIKRTPKVLILQMHFVPTIDATGIHVLEDVLRKVKHEGTTLIICGANAQILDVMRQAGMMEKIRMENFQSHLDQALARAKTIIEAKP